ncbi:MAG: gamma-glutamylcyclotransferase family protein [Candidatus Woesearchaeota archaeon]
MAWYFEYGKNLNLNNLEKSIGYMPNSFKAILFNHRISFRKRTNNAKTGILDIVRKKGEHVRGVVYEINDDDILKLDFDNGVYKNHFSRKKLKVNFENENDFISAYTYQMPIKRKLSTPSKVYVNQVTKGLRNHKIDSNYISLFLKKAFIKYDDNLINESSLTNLEDVCNGNLFLNESIYNIPYCKIALTKKNDCKYISDNIDQNGMYVCMHPDVSKKYFKNHFKPNAANIFFPNENMFMRLKFNYND